MGEQRTVLILSVILCFAVVSISEIGIVKAESTIYIRANGSVEGTDKILRDGNVYTFTDDIFDSVVVERDDIVIDGAGYTLQGTVSGIGIHLIDRRNVTIKNIEIKDFVRGIRLDNSSNNTISGNTITAEVGILLEASNNNTIHGNIITKTSRGISLMGASLVASTSNIISGNYITNSEKEGIRIFGSSNQIIGNYIANSRIGTYIFSSPFDAGSSNNLFYHNSYVNNFNQIYIEKVFAIPVPINAWDNGAEGNYWGNYYLVVDNNGDGIGDSPIVFDANNRDNYPLVASLMSPLYVFDAGTWEWTNYNVYVISNSTVSDFSFNPEEDAILRFNVTGETGTTGFCNVTIPKDLLNAEGNWVVLVDGYSVTPTVNEDTSDSYIYFTYPYSTKTVEIIGTTAIPEFPSWIILPLFLTATLVILFYSKRLRVCLRHF